MDRARAIYEPPWRRTVDSTASLRNVFKRYTKMRSNLPSAAAAARRSHASHLSLIHISEPTRR
eukprot:6119714-Lingulodinium_polyedra.AAC.1